MDKNRNPVIDETKLKLVSTIAHPSAEVLDVLQQDERRYLAMLGQDLAELDAVLDEQMIYTHSSGRLETKAEFLDLLSNGRTVYLSINREVQGYIHSGDATLLYGRTHMEVSTAAGAKTIHCLYQSLWLRRPQGWRMASWAPTTL